VNLCVIGHGRHGKDTVAEYISELWPGFTYAYGTSWYAKDIVCDKFFAGSPDLRAAYNTEIFWQDRHAHRKFWFDTIRDYNATDNGVALYKDCLREQNILTGIRKASELYELKKQGIVDCTLWVERDGWPLEAIETMELDKCDADFTIENDGTLVSLREKISRMSRIFQGNRALLPS